MEYILIKKGKDRTAIASNTVRSIRKIDFTDSNSCYLYLERDNDDSDKHLVDNFEIAEMSASELTTWLKGEKFDDE